MNTEMMTRDQLIEAVQKLAAFKAYVHKRLDDAGVPVDPESTHKAEGCRIGGRLDCVLADREKLAALPKTRDGVPIVPGMTVYRAFGATVGKWTAAKVSANGFEAMHPHLDGSTALAEFDASRMCSTIDAARAVDAPAPN